MPIANNTVNAVAMTVLPDAPIAPATGLRVPTIAVATSGGISIVKHNGAVVSSTVNSAFAFTQVAITPRIVSAARSSNANWFYALDPNNLGTTFSLASDNATTAPDFQIGGGATTKYIAANRSDVARVASSVAAIQRLRINEAVISRSVSATIANTYNTGWLPGDIRRAYLSNAEVGSVTGPELVTNGTFDTDTAWTKGASLTIADGVAQFPAGTESSISQAIALVSGKTYRVSFTVSGATGSGARVRFGGQTATGFTNFSGNGTFVALITALSGSTTIDVFSIASSFNGAVDNVSVREAVLDRSYKAASALVEGTLTKAQLATGTSLVGYSGFSASNYLREPYSADLDFGTGEWTCSAWVNIPTANAAAGTIFDRAAASGTRITLGITAGNLLTATAFDGTTTRTVTTSAAYNTATWLKARVNYTTDGTLAILVNGREVATARGNPLLTLNNSSAVLTIGNSFALDAPFPGSIALLKLGATVPTYEQSQFMYEQEKQLFRAGAQSVLPDSGSIVDMAYDDATDRWIAVSAANESYWTGLVRNNVIAVPAGSYTKVVAGSGVELTARSTTNIGVDITMPAYGLREELVKRAEAAARLGKELAILDYVGGFTGNTTTGSTAITSVAGLSIPTSYIGSQISGTGIPAGATIVAVSGTTIYISAAATANGTGVSISFLDFKLPAGMEAKEVVNAGVVQQEGSTKNFTRLYDGFVETVRFGAAPGVTAWVQAKAQRISA